MYLNIPPFLHDIRWLNYSVIMRKYKLGELVWLVMYSNNYLIVQTKPHTSTVKANQEEAYTVECEMRGKHLHALHFQLSSQSRVQSDSNHWFGYYWLNLQLKKYLQYRCPLTIQQIRDKVVSDYWKRWIIKNGFLSCLGSK